MFAFQQERLRYVDNREEMIAQGFADLERGGGQVSRRPKGMSKQETVSGNILLYYSELLHQHGSKLLDYVGPVVGVLELNNDSLNNLIIDAGQVNFGGWGAVVGVLHLDRGCPRPGRGERRGIRVCLAALGGRCVVPNMGPFYFLGVAGLSVCCVGGAGGGSRGERGRSGSHGRGGRRCAIARRSRVSTCVRGSPGGVSFGEGDGNVNTQRGERERLATGVVRHVEGCCEQEETLETSGVSL